MVACSAGLFRVGESLFMFAIVVATIFDFMTEEGKIREIWLENKWNKTLGFSQRKISRSNRNI